MRDLTPALLPRLESHRLDGLNAGPQAVYPYYEGYSLANITPSLCHWLGVPGLGGLPLGEEILGLYNRVFQHVILLVVDGMGLNTLQAALELAKTDPDYAVWGELAADGALAAITSIVPSTTSAALTTFWTGSTPAEHGIVGYEVWLKEYSMIANMILHAPASFTGEIGSLRKAGFDPQSFLPVPTFGPHLLSHRVRPYAFQHHTIASSGLSTMLLPDVKVTGYRSLGDLWVTLGEMMAAYPDEKNYVYIYWGDLDEHSHRFGPQDPRVAREFATFSRQLGYFLSEHRKQSHGDTLLLVTADHGHIFTPRRPEYEVRRHPGLQDTLIMTPSGEARLPFAYVRPGREEDFLRYLEITWPGLFLPVASTAAVQAGLFGSRGVYPRTLERVGDYVVIPQEDAYWWFGSRDNPLLGRHGGMSRTEMLVPLLSAVI